MSRALRSMLAALAPFAVAASIASCGGGGGGGDGDDGGGEVWGFRYDEANMEFAAGLAARALDAFPTVSDLVTPALVTLGASTMQSGVAAALPACAVGSASLTWTDGSGDGAWSAGDTARIDLGGCRVHAGDGIVLDGALTLVFSSVVRGPPRSVAARLELALDTHDGQAGTLRGPVALTATSADGERHSFVFTPSADSVVTATGGAPFELACFDVRDLPDPAVGLRRRVVILGALRALGDIITFDPGAQISYDDEDVAAGGGFNLLSLATGPCAPFGITPDGINSDLSMLRAFVLGEVGEMRLQLFRPPGTEPDRSVTCPWSDLLCPSALGILNGTNAVRAAEAVLVTGLVLPRQVGALGLDIVIGAATGDPWACTSGGYGISITPGPLAPGHVATITFESCGWGGFALDGSMTLAITSVTGDVSTSTYEVATSVGAVDVTATELDTSRVSGAFRFERAAFPGGVAERSHSEPGATLSLEEQDGDETRLAGFSLRSARTDGGAFTTASAGDSVTLSESGISGALEVLVTAPVSGAEPDPAGSGDLEITATDATSVQVHIEGPSITLSLDADGDGTPDATIPTSWDAFD